MTFASSAEQHDGLSQAEIDAFKSHLRRCWWPSAGPRGDNIKVVFRVMFKRDGTLMRSPILVQAPKSKFGRTLASTAKRALLGCQPYTMLKPERYDQWKVMLLTFDPREMPP